MIETLNILSVLTSIRRVPLYIYIVPVLIIVFVYIAMSITAWVVLTPIWREIAGEWEIVGKFVAFLAWLFFFPIIFNTLLGATSGLIFDGFATRVDGILGESETKPSKSPNLFADSAIRFATQTIFMALAFFTWHVQPHLGVLVCAVFSCFFTVVTITAPAMLMRGIGFIQQTGLLIKNMSVQIVLIGVAVTIMMHNPFIMIFTLGPIMVTGHLIGRFLAQRHVN